MIDAQQIINDLSTDEELRLFVYDDATGHPILPGSTVIGHPTIGIGRALDTHGLSGAECQSLLRSDVTETDLGLQGALRFYSRLSPNIQRVLVEMAFNLGLRGLLGFRLMLGCVEQSDWVGAAQQMLNSHWAGQVGPKRAQHLANLMLQG